eukprot:174171-Amphidinium_carterae.1
MTSLAPQSKTSLMVYFDRLELCRINSLINAAMLKASVFPWSLIGACLCTCKVGVLCQDETKRRAVNICRGANVLDNTVLCPGVTVGQRAVLGTNTLGAPGQYFPPDTINTGNKGGQAVFLRKKGKGTAQVMALEAEAHRRLESRTIWTTFNIGLCSMALLEPLFRAVK